MVFRLLGLSLLLISTVSFAQGRRPAVEDFVGIEVEESQVTPYGSETLYNLEQDLNSIESQKVSPQTIKTAPVASKAKNFTPSTFFGLGMVLGLPLFIWLMMMGHLKKKASIESASNIEVLEKYRKDRERKIQKDTRKAS